MKKRKILYTNILLVMIVLFLFGLFSYLLYVKNEIVLFSDDSTSIGDETFANSIKMRVIDNKVEFMIADEVSENPNYEYQLLTKMEGEDMYTVLVDWQDEFVSEYSMLQGGTYSFQYRIRDKQNGALQNIFVGDASNGERYLDYIMLVPDVLTMKIGEEISVIPKVSSCYIETQERFEYQTLGRYNDDLEWNIISEYEKAPLSPFILDREGIYNVCVRIKDINTGKVQISNTVQFSISYFHDENMDNLLRELIASYDYYKYDERQVYRLISKEVTLISQLFVSEYLNQKNEDVYQKIKDKYVCSIQDNKEVITIVNNEGGLQKIDLQNHTVVYGNSTIDISLNSHPSIAKVLDLMANYDEKAMVAAIINHLVYNGYQYSSISEYENDSYNAFLSTKAQCKQLAQIVACLLGESGYSVRAISCNRNQYGHHAVVEVSLEDKLIVLDPTYNIIYPGSFDDLSEIDDQMVIILPQVFDREAYWHNDAWKDKGNEEIIVNYD